MVQFRKPFDAIASEDLHFLIEYRVAEGQNLEYKKQQWGRNDEEVREMLRDISAMANAYVESPFMLSSSYQSSSNPH